MTSPARRQYAVAIRLAYAGGRLPTDAADSLKSALMAAAPIDAEVSLTTSGATFTIVSIAAAIRAPNPLTALSWVNTFVDEALDGSGLTEEFDITGKDMRVSPATGLVNNSGG